MPPPGVPAAFLDPVPDALRSLLHRYARRRGPFTTDEAAARYGLAVGVAESELRGLEADEKLVRGSLRPGSTGHEWCDPDVLRRIRRASVAALRKEVEPVDGAALVRFEPGWHGVDRGTRGSLDRLRDALVPLQGLPLAPDVLERDVLPRRVPGYRQDWLDALCSGGELVWVGVDGGKVALLFRDEAPLLGRPPGAAAPPAGESHAAVRAALAGGPRFFGDLVRETNLPQSELLAALFDLAWAGEVTNDAFAPLRSPRAARGAAAATPRAPAAGRRLVRRRQAPTGAAQGRWSLADGLFAGPPDERDRQRALAELLLERYGVVTRAAVQAEGLSGGFGAVYAALRDLETLGACRRGYFVAGAGGAQFALAGAVERLRELRDEPDLPETVVLAASDPANPYGAALPWPARAAGRASRSAGAYVVLDGGHPVLFCERGGRTLLTLDDDQGRVGRAVEALAAEVRRGRPPRLGLERIDGEAAIGSPLEPVLRAVGFLAGPRRLSLRAPRA
jgi:ATP-dependent Lhr-like helicase